MRRDRALEELGEPIPSREESVRLYAQERLRAATEDDANLLVEIEFVAQLYLDTNMQDDLQDFYLLRCACNDLQTSDIQWYWPEADRSNIVAIMKQRVEAFVNG